MITTIAAVLLAGCGESQQSSPVPETKPGPPVRAPTISIHEAAKKGNIEAVKQHIAAGTDVNLTFRVRSPLHYASGAGHKEIIELLIANGSEVNAKIESGLFNGKTPLDLVIKFNKPKTAALLRKHGGKTGEELKAGKK